MEIRKSRIRRIRPTWWSGIVLNRVIRVDLIEKVMCEQRLEGKVFRQVVSKGGVVQSEEKLEQTSQNRECQPVWGKARRLVAEREWVRYTVVGVTEVMGGTDPTGRVGHCQDFGFFLNKPGICWRIFGGFVTWSDSHFKGITLAAVLRIDYTRVRVKTQRTVKRLLQ